WSKRGMSPAQRFEQLLQEVELCDQVGFDYAFSVEHHFTRNESWMSSPSIFVAAAAQRTSRIRLGPMGYVVPLYQPLRLLEEAALLDQLCNGRFELGLVPGITPHFFGPFEADFPNRRELTRDLIELAKAAYGAEGEFSFQSEHIQIQDVELSVLPVQRPHPPIWWETRDPDTLEYVAAEGFSVGYFVLMPRQEVAPRYREFLRLWQKAGHAHRPRLGYWSLVYVGESDEAALATALPHAMEALSLFFSVGKGASQEGTVKMFEGRGESGAAELCRNLTDPDYVLDNDLIFIGSPDTVAAKIEKASQEGVFNTLFCEMNFGQLDQTDLMRSIGLMGESVIPRLRSCDIV
ncbi:MAG: LLM class flavin-dependent oxidoreductase, partial [Myxococcales bacterium]|nr:LLM class flavin-dependent oxidoreductase [Myxococcales bacterium]